MKTREQASHAAGSAAPACATAILAGTAALQNPYSVTAAEILPSRT